MKSIREFPRPTDITGIRSWFGLVEQVAWAFSKTALMLPFRELLSKKESFLWTTELQTAFETAKEEIAGVVEKGVKAFKLGEQLCLVTDWDGLRAVAATLCMPEVGTWLLQGWLGRCCRRQSFLYCSRVQVRANQGGDAWHPVGIAPHQFLHPRVPLFACHDRPQAYCWTTTKERLRRNS